MDWMVQVWTGTRIFPLSEDGKTPALFPTYDEAKAAADLAESEWDDDVYYFTCERAS